jgi:hypothetical protein
MSEQTKPPGSIEEPEATGAEARADEPAGGAASIGALPAAGASTEARAGEQAARLQEPSAFTDGLAGRPVEAAEAVPLHAERRALAAAEPPPRPSRGARAALTESREPLYREAGGFRLRLEPADLARLRELPGSKGRTDRELGEEFFEKQATRFVQSLSEDVTPPAEVRVVVDPYSRQAFLAIERTIRSIVSF